MNSYFLSGISAAGNADQNKVDNKQIEKKMLSNIVDTGFAIPVKVVLPHDSKRQSYLQKTFENCISQSYVWLSYPEKRN